MNKQPLRETVKYWVSGINRYRRVLILVVVACSVAITYAVITGVDVNWVLIVAVALASVGYSVAFVDYWKTKAALPLLALGLFLTLVLLMEKERSDQIELARAETERDSTQSRLDTVLSESIALRGSLEVANFKLDTIAAQLEPFSALARDHWPHISTDSALVQLYDRLTDELVGVKRQISNLQPRTKCYSVDTIKHTSPELTHLVYKFAVNSQTVARVSGFWIKMVYDSPIESDSCWTEGEHVRIGGRVRWQLEDGRRSIVISKESLPSGAGVVVDVGFKNLPTLIQVISRPVFWKPEET